MFDPNEREEHKLDAYYYSFDATGVPEIDNILAAVASAGKRYQHTRDWNDEECGDESCVDSIQRMAEDAAKALRAINGGRQ